MLIDEEWKSCYEKYTHKGCLKEKEPYLVGLFNREL